MEVITKGNVKADGLPKIYVCGTKRDMQGYFSEVSRKLFLNGSYALYPYSEEQEQEEGFPFYISEMQLVVIIVTERFLKEENTARNIIFEYAKERQIPILPLLMEKDLESEFNKVCGSIHCMNMTEEGRAAISNEKKLADYLESVLLDQKLIQRIREAFVGYIFLSYRQKDWEKGLELMRLIHREPGLRDLAIWYDGFLTYGRDFDEAILNQIHGCSLFALTVTPNLLEGENYVKIHEYPEASRPKAPYKPKAVLPVEMIPTDRDLLKQEYENLPTCFTPEQREEIGRYIVENLDESIDLEKRRTADHEYLIALAYHSGIRVETNKDLALTMLVHAADEGNLNAVKKIVEIYRQGDGREVSYEQAIAWQRRLIRGFVLLHQQEQSERSISRIFEALFDLLEMYVGLTDFENIDATLVELNRLIEQQKTGISETEYHYFRAKFGLWYARYLSKVDQVCRDGDREEMGQKIQISLQDAREHGVRLVSASVYERNIDLLFEIEIEFGEFFESLGNYKAALDIVSANLISYRQVYEEFGDEQSLLKLAVIYSHVAEYAYRSGNLEYAEMLFQKSLDVPMRFTDYGDMNVVNASKMRSHLSDIYKESGRFDEALKQLQLACKGLQGHFEKTGSFQTLRMLAVCIDKVGNIYKALGMLCEAMDCYRKTLEYRLVIYHQNPSDMAIRDVAVGYMKQGEVLMQTAEQEQALKQFDHAIEWYKEGFSKAVTRVGECMAKKGVAHCLNKKGQIYWKKGQLQQAVDLFLLSIQHYEELMKVSDDVDYLNSYANVNFYVASIFLSNNQIEEGIEFLETSHEAVLRQNTYAANMRSLQLQENVEKMLERYR